ncbi:hypothetical protein AMTRI_Chr03g44560 [Amborella trichopoda]
MIVVEASTRGGALGQVNISYSSLYQWWYTVVLRTNEDLYTGARWIQLANEAQGLINWPQHGLASSSQAVLTPKRPIKAQTK